MVDGETCAVTAVMVTKSRWNAHGDVRGVQISADGSSEGRALSNWVYQAENTGSRLPFGPMIHRSTDAIHGHQGHRAGFAVQGWAGETVSPPSGRARSEAFRRGRAPAIRPGHAAACYRDTAWPRSAEHEAPRVSRDRRLGDGRRGRGAGRGVAKGQGVQLEGGRGRRDCGIAWQGSAGARGRSSALSAEDRTEIPLLVQDVISSLGNRH